MKNYTYQEWMDEAKQRFGDDFRQWKFICPACGHIQSVQDFIDLGLDPNDAFKECIGRHNGNMKPANKSNGNGCDWCSYGLFGTLWKGICVITDDETKMEIFDFAPADKEDIHD